jgi:signal transduction histidine kinase
MEPERRTGIERRARRTAERDRLHSIVERMADGVVVVGVDGMIRFANPAAERLFGRSASSLLGQVFGWPVVSDESTEVEVRRPGGEVVTAELRMVESDWERAPAVLVSLRDVTDRKQLELERVARAKAESADQAKSEFLGIMSHELRTPLNAVLGYTSLLELGNTGPVTDAQRAQLARIRASGTHLLDLVNEMLDLAKAGAGTLALHAGTAGAKQTAVDAIAIVWPKAASRDVRLLEECHGDSDLLYAGDEPRVRQILVHLLDNATKFTDAGGEVRVSCEGVAQPDEEARAAGIGPGPWVRWQVTDTGVGIEPLAARSIFEPFVQVETGHARSADGSGLGLTVSRSLARLMRGDITVRSAPGAGSCFTLWLPAAPSVTTAAPPGGAG